MPRHKSNKLFINLNTGEDHFKPAAKRNGEFSQIKMFKLLSC